jgi:hypothetical protein
LEFWWCYYAKDRRNGSGNPQFLFAACGLGTAKK